MDSAIFLFWLQKLISSPRQRSVPTATPIKHKIPYSEPKNIRESTIDFTAHFGEINPNMLYLCRRGQSGLQRAVFAFFPSVQRESMKKNVRSSIFRKKTSKFLSSLPFKMQTIDNQWEYDDASVGIEYARRCVVVFGGHSLHIWPRRLT